MAIVEGAEELDRLLDDLISGLHRGIPNATEAAGKVIFDEVQGRSKGSIKNNLALSVSEKRNGAEAVIEVKESAKGGEEHHAVFLEYGTSKMAAQPFMRPGFEAVKGKAVEEFNNQLANDLKG